MEIDNREGWGTVTNPVHRLLCPQVAAMTYPRQLLSTGSESSIVRILIFHEKSEIQILCET
jgi:hypothetical protein